MILSIIIFFLVLLGLGISVTFFIGNDKFSNNSLERFIMKLGFGLGAVAVLIILMNTLKIPLDWKYLLGLSWIVPIITFIKNSKENKFQIKIPKISLKIKKDTLFIFGAIAIALSIFIVFLQGSFVYPWLEDGDPWEHAQGVKYVSEAKTYSQDPSWLTNERQAHYLEPYNPVYDSFLGMLHQISPDMEWTLKFFNVLIIGLGHLWFFFFARDFFKSDKKALLASLLIAVIPSFLSHFIWASSMAIALFFPAFYATFKSEQDKKWIIPAVLTIAGILLSQSSNAFIFGILFGLYWLTSAIMKKNRNMNVFISGALGLILALSIFYIPAYIKFGHDEFMVKSGLQASYVNKDAVGGGGGVWYHWKDFWSSDLYGKIDNAVGFGKVLFGVFMLSLAIILIGYTYRTIKTKTFAKERDLPLFVTLLWLIFSFIGVHGARLPVSLMSHRFWAILSIPVVLLTTIGIFSLFGLIKLASKKKESLMSRIIFIVCGIAAIAITIITPSLEQGNNIFTKYPIAGGLLGVYFVFIAIASIIGFTSKNEKTTSKLARYSLWAIIIIGVIITSALPKISVQTSQWPPHAYATQGEIQDYFAIKSQFPLNTNIFPYCNNPSLRDIQKIIGNNMDYPYWHDELVNVKRNKFNMTAQDIYNSLKKYDIQFMLFDGDCADEGNNTALNAEITKLVDSGLFQAMNKGNTVIMLKVK